MSSDGIRERGDRPQECSVRDNSFVEPCWVLADCAHPIGASGRGIFWQWLYKTGGATMVASRSFFILKSGEHAKKGIVLNNCPFCGVDISGPVASRAQANSPNQAVAPGHNGGGEQDG